MDSKIYLKEKVENKERKFGAATEYYPTIVIDGNGGEANALFTEHEINVAITRAGKNPEDIPEDKSFWQHLFG